MHLIDKVKASLLDGQHGHPKGLIGRLLGEQMVRQHIPETAWTISLLDVQPDDQILELGFGAGKAIELVAAKASHGHITGIDISHEMLHSASRRNAQAIQKGLVELQQGDLTTLPFKENSFDKVFSIQTFYFWPDPLQVIATILRVLKPGGRLLITLSTGTTEIPDTSGLMHYQQMIDEHILPGMLQAGFTTAFAAQGPDSRQYKTTGIVGTK